MRVMLTGSRAPATLELARRFHEHGDEVYLGDSLIFGCANLSRQKKRSYRTPRPRQARSDYIEKLARIVRSQHIDLLIPTCEEVFTIADAKSQFECEVFVDTLDKIQDIHNKWTFSQTATNGAGQVPETSLIESASDLKPFLDCSNEYVFKPVYSRFASKTLVRPKTKRLERVQASSIRPWIAQKYIQGTEYSSYSIARNGKLSAHCTYYSSFRAGVGAGICFEAVTNESILCFVKEFIELHKFTGQIGFDFIVSDDGKVWVLEGNPRSTSGLHLFERTSDLIHCFLGDSEEYIVAHSRATHMVGAAMLVYGFPQAVVDRNLKRYVRSLLFGKDVLFAWRDPLPLLGMPITLCELLWIAMRRRISLQEATTWDIEWNGESFESPELTGVR